MKAYETLEKMGVEYECAYKYVGKVGTKSRRRVEIPEKITFVRWVMSPVEWCHLCMREGEYYLGGCCGQLGYFQDWINSIFRDSGWIRLQYFPEVVDQYCSHDGFEMFKKPGDLLKRASTKKGYQKLEPLDKLAAIWHVIKRRARSEQRKRIQSTENSG